MSEHDLQVSVARFLSLALPADAVWFHVPNGGHRSKASAGKMKAEGVIAGVADCLVIYRGQAIGIELKTLKGRLSPQQKSWASSFERAGGWYYVARSIDQVKEILESCGVILKIRSVA